MERVGEIVGLVYNRDIGFKKFMKKKTCFLAGSMPHTRVPMRKVRQIRGGKPRLSYPHEESLFPQPIQLFPLIRKGRCETPVAQPARGTLVLEL